MNRLSKLSRILVPLLAFLITCIAIFIAIDGPILFGVLLYTEQLVSLVLGASLALCFLSYGFIKTRIPDVVPWYDLLFAAVGLYVGVHLALRYPVLSQDFYRHPRETLWIGALLFPVLLESLRRTAGWSLVVVVTIFFLYGLTAHLVPGSLQGLSSSLPDLLSFLVIDSTAMFGTPLIIVVTIVILFIFFGNVLMTSGGSVWFTDLSMAVVGNTRGGSAKISVVASALFGSISGSAVANVASTGVVTIPLMKSSGFPARSAAAFEAIASTGGQILPPVMGAAAFLMAEYLQVPYGEVIYAATIPAVLFFVAVLIQADLEAAKLSIPPIPKDLIKPLGSLIKTGWYFSIPFVLLITLLFVWNMSPAKAALFSTIGLILSSCVFNYHKISFKGTWNAVLNTGRASVGIVIIGAAAGIVIGIFEHTGLSFGLTFLMIEFGQQSLFLLLCLTGVICILLGMGMPTTGIYLLVATLAAPPLVELGIEPMAAHLFILYYGLLSMISPPVAVAAFTAASLAESGPMETAVTAVRIGWPAFIVPFLFVYSPSMLMQGDVSHIVLSIVTALGGVWFVSAAVVGYLKRKLVVFERMIICVTGLMLLTPADMFIGAIWTNFAGISIASIVIAMTLYDRRTEF